MLCMCPDAREFRSAVTVQWLRARSAAHAPSTRHARDARLPHASTRHLTLHHARPDHNIARSMTLHCKTHIMRQNTAANSTQHAAHSPNSPIGRPTASGPRAPTPRAQNRACAPVHRGHSTKQAPAKVRSGPSWAHSTCYAHYHAACRSPATSRHALPSLMSAQHAHAPAGARTSRARTARPAQARRGSFRSRKWV